jgi:hypothetical protein
MVKNESEDNEQVDKETRQEISVADVVALRLQVR